MNEANRSICIINEATDVTVRQARGTIPADCVSIALDYDGPFPTRHRLILTPDKARELLDKLQAHIGDEKEID